MADFFLENVSLRLKLEQNMSVLYLYWFVAEVKKKVRFSCPNSTEAVENRNYVFNTWFHSIPGVGK